MSDKNRIRMKKVIAAAVIYFPLLILELSGHLEIPDPAVAALFMVPYLIVGFDVIKKAVRNISKGHVFDENFLMLIATVGAFVVGEYAEAAAVMLFYQVGELFEGIAVGRTRSAVASVMDIAPEYAGLETDEGVQRVDPDEVEPGSIVVIKPGERVPLDGVVISGESALDTAALTGESMPRQVREGDTVLSGCINGNGTLRIRTSGTYDDSTAARILELVENASSKKAKIESFITRFARYYTPAVTIGAALLAILGPLLIGGGFKTWLFRACTFLVVSCPCALVISVPLGFFCGIGAASRMGLLVKGSNYLEILAGTKVMVFDKTGTLTEGRFSVSSLQGSEGVDEDSLLKVAAHAESFSTHPLAVSLTDEYKRRGGVIDESRVAGAVEIPGRGVSAGVDGSQILVGSRALMKEKGLLTEKDADSDPKDTVGTEVHVAKDDRYMGCIVISDSVRSEAKETIGRIKKAGVDKVVMLTGDDAKTAASVADIVGVDEHHASLLPQDKVDRVEMMLKEMEDGSYLAFVGDGINDTPVLARSDLGIAMGGIGSDAAIEAADIVLMQDNISRLPEAVSLARRTLRIVRQNIYFSLAVKLLVLVLGAAGYANMWAAVFADVGTSVIAITNSMRLLGGKAKND